MSLQSQSRYTVAYGAFEMVQYQDQIKAENGVDAGDLGFELTESSLILIDYIAPPKPNFATAVEPLSSQPPTDW